MGKDQFSEGAHLLERPVEPCCNFEIAQVLLVCVLSVKKLIFNWLILHVLKLMAQILLESVRQD